MDLSNCGVKKFTGNWNFNSIQLKFPSCCTYFDLDPNLDVPMNFENVEHIEFLDIHGWRWGQGLKTPFTTIKESCSIEKFRVRIDQFFSNNNSFNFFKEISELNGYNLKIKRLEDRVDCTDVGNCESLEGIEYIDGLKEICFSATGFPKLKDISQLESQKNTLKKIIISNASISDCRVFKELKNLTYVDLQNNPFGDYVGDASNMDNWNLKLICEAVIEGVRRENIKNNTNILGTVMVKGAKCTNWSYFTNNNWTPESNYGEKNS